MPVPSDPARVRLATAADHDAVLTTVVAAFADDPAFRWFFPDPEHFEEQATAFVDAVLRPRLATQTVWVVDDGAAVAMWEPPGAPGASVEGVVPPDTYQRLRRWDRAAHRFIPDVPLWYLGILATHPSHAGAGLAKLAAAPGRARAAADGSTCWLETASARNVAMYERRGWTTAGSVDVDGVTCTVMHTP